MELVGSLTEKTSISQGEDSITYADSAKTQNCFQNKHLFVKGTLRNREERTILFANNTSVKTMLTVEVVLRSENATIGFKEVQFIPTLGYNSVSTGWLVVNGIGSRFRLHDVLLEVESDGKFIGRGITDAVSDMYTLRALMTFNKSTNTCAVSVAGSIAEHWHRRLAHMNPEDLQSVHRYAEGFQNCRFFPPCIDLANLENFMSFNSQEILKAQE